MSTPSVIVLGSISIDLTATTPHLPAPGETVLGRTLTTGTGGKGHNQAVAAARAAGGDTAVEFIGTVGTDGYTDTLVGALERAGVGTTFLRQVEGPCGTALIWLDDTAENSIVVVPAANALFGDLAAADLDAIAGAGILVGQLEVPMELMVAGATHAAAHGVPVLLNPSPVQELPAELVAALTVLVVNEGEAAALGPAVLDAVPHLVTTLGGRGARYRGPDGGVVTVPAPRVTPVDTTGAGDTFAGALAAAWTAGREPADAVAWACVAGALATTLPGAGDCAPLRAQIDELAARTA
ncbi:ribokinase [Nakamurella flavida]|nr:ribokinase [Nakamurella flavida]